MSTFLRHPLLDSVGSVGLDISINLPNAFKHCDKHIIIAKVNIFLFRGFQYFGMTNLAQSFIYVTPLTIKVPRLPCDRDLLHRTLG